MSKWDDMHTRTQQVHASNAPEDYAYSAADNPQQYWQDDHIWNPDNKNQGRRLVDLVDAGSFRKFGLHQFLQGQSMGPDRVNAMFNAQAGPMPTMQAPGVGGMQQYGRGAQDMAARAAALQTGQAYRSMGGMNPAARAAAASQVAQSAAGNVGQAGVQGMMQGGQFMQNAAQANYGGQMQERGAQRNLFNAALNRTQQVGQWGADATLQAQIGGMRARDAQRAAKRAETQAYIGMGMDSLTPDEGMPMPM